MTKQDTLPPLEQERTAFEAWAKRRCFDLTILEDDDADEYKELETESAWESWQARAALAAQAPPPIPRVLFDGFAVLQALDPKAKARTSGENVSDVLDAVVKIMRASVCKCKGTGWVCENHDSKPWGDSPGECKCGAGKPCLCNPGATVEWDAVIASADQSEVLAAPQQAQGVASAYRVKTKGGRSWVIDGAPSASDLAEIENLGDSVELLAAAPQAAPAPAPQSLPISALEEQQMFDDWCPYKGSPDPRVVWAAAIDAANGLLSGLTERKAPAPQALTELTDEQIAAAVRPLYRSDQAAKLGLDDDIRTVRAVFGIGAASAGGE